MKTIPPICPEPESGRKYWRSLDQLAETPEFRQWAEREFPAGASEWEDPVSRRHFVKIMSASFLLAGLGVGASGCRRPEQKILPFAKMPENYVHGVPQFYASAIQTRGSAIPLVVKSTDGRPIKIEGNAIHPDSNGGTDRYAQASILNLYDPDRASRFTRGGNNVSVEAASDALKAIGQKFQQGGGEGLAFLVERSNSPSRARLQKQIAQKLPQAGWHVFEPVDLDVGVRAASQGFGKSVTPQYKFDAAKTIVSLDCDFIGSEQDAQNNIRGFSKKRHVESPHDEMSRLYVVESLMTLTGVNADHRLRVPASSVIQFAAALAKVVLKQTGGAAELPNLGMPNGADPAFASQWVKECAQDLLQSRGRSLVVAGYRQPLAVHLIAHALNAGLANVGKTVVYHELPEAKEGTIAELASALNGGKVDTLVILNSNPAYTAPADLNWLATQRKAKNVVRLGYYEDETFPLCDWHLPTAHFLESWGDALTADGTLVPIQPLIAPLFDGITELEVLARILGANATSPYEIARETFAAMHKENDLEEAWKRYLHDGFLADSAAKPIEVSFNAQALTQAFSGAKATAPTANSLELVFHRDYSVDDGRYANNGWLQEMPDPITKMVWDNAVLISRKTAQELHVENGQIVEIKLGNASIRGPIWVQPGQADYSLGLALGYGRQSCGRVGKGIGFDAYPLRTSEVQYIATGATLQKTAETYMQACTQDHWSMEGRPIIREATHEQYEEHPDFAKRMNMEQPPGGLRSLYPNPLEELKTHGLHQWGMSIDLNMCVGCQACMMACQSENNVPIVGKDQVKRGREMHWIRLDRYYSGLPSKQAKFETYQVEEKQQFEEWIDDPQVVTQPMLCQHCEAAPCENVCPVNATVHDQEGLNLMVYNRCVGTRYCSNNCPYKVRRFNYFDYNKRGIGKNLYFGPLRKRPEEEYELTKMIKNPDVTVRMRGVMEKCTFCIQRIEGAKIAQKVKAGASGDVIVKTDSFTTACAQACPAGAIVFGNLKDPESRVSKLKKLDRDYTVLEFLNTRPRLTYLAKVRNPNKQMPDFATQYGKGTLSFQNYEQHAGNPFEGEAESAVHPAAEATVEKGAH
jgi:MoCo/4Fe-4S cofactor protein with predicted Tat translocation signal